MIFCIPALELDDFKIGIRLACVFSVKVVEEDSAYSPGFPANEKVLQLKARGRYC
jgi:hypothetical protein